MELEVSTTLIPKSIIGHDPEPVGQTNGTQFRNEYWLLIFKAFESPEEVISFTNKRLRTLNVTYLCAHYVGIELSDTSKGGIKKQNLAKQITEK
jgi:hypothetical protein